MRAGPCARGCVGDRVRGDAWGMGRLVRDGGVGMRAWQSGQGLFASGQPEAAVGG